jgi:hypothetical protein
VTVPNEPEPQVVLGQGLHAREHRGEASGRLQRLLDPLVAVPDEARPLEPASADC